MSKQTWFVACQWYTTIREPLLKRKASTADLLGLTSSDQLLLKLQTLFNYYKRSHNNKEVERTEHSPSVSVPLQQALKLTDGI